jgi:hypothetical protein
MGITRLTDRCYGSGNKLCAFDGFVDHVFVIGFSECVVPLLVLLAAKMLLARF